MIKKLIILSVILTASAHSAHDIEDPAILKAQGAHTIKETPLQEFSSLIPQEVKNTQPESIQKNGIRELLSRHKHKIVIGAGIAVWGACMWNFISNVKVEEKPYYGLCNTVADVRPENNGTVTFYQTDGWVRDCGLPNWIMETIARTMNDTPPHDIHKIFPLPDGGSIRGTWMPWNVNFSKQTGSSTVLTNFNPLIGAGVFVLPLLLFTYFGLVMVLV